MLVIDIRALAEGPVATDGSIQPGDPALEGVPGRLESEVRVSGLLATAGHGHHFWRGDVRVVVSTECRRCLAPLRLTVEPHVEVLFSTDQDADDDPSTYSLDERATAIDLRPAVREELILAMPQYPLCREDCRGLCPRCGADLNAGPCDCPAEHDPRWGALLEQRQSSPDS